MTSYRKYVYFPLLLLVCNFAFAISATAQEITFKKFFTTDTSITNVRAFDGIKTLDGGYAYTGLALFGSIEKPILVKVDCKGRQEYIKTFANSGSWNNIFMKVINTVDSGVVMLTNIGTFQAYNLLVVKVDANGNTQWRRIINFGQGNDMGQCIKATRDGGYIIGGSTSTYGSDIGSLSYSDMYIVKLNSSGVVTFTNVIGQASALDDIKDIIETQDGGFAFTGTVLDKGFFNIVVGKINAANTMVWIKAFGDTLSRNGGYALVENNAGDLFVFGTTTLHNPSPSFNDDISHLLMRIESSGVLQWQKVFNGSNNGSDNSLSLCWAKDSTLILGTETMSYPSTGFTPNKQVAHRFTQNGDLIATIGYNTTGSQYTRVQSANNGFTLSGFGTINSPINARPNLYKIDSVLQTTCTEYDWTALTQFQPAIINDWNYIGNFSSGSTTMNTLIESTFDLTDTTLCEAYPPIDATYTAMDTCFGLPINFTATYTAAATYIWLLGNGDTIITTTPILNYTYKNSGTFATKLIITNGCDTAVGNLNVVAKGNSNVQIIASNATPTIGQFVRLELNTAAINYLWNEGSTASSINVNAAGQYWVSAFINGCQVSDTIQLTFGAATQKGTVFIPDVITPNNDDLNDDLEIITTGAYQFNRIRVYNRWGKMVFESKDKNNKFNGRVQGELAGIETYYYYVVFDVLGIQETFKGDVTVVR